VGLPRPLKYHLFSFASDPRFIADSHEVVRAGVCKLLEGGRDLEIVGEATMRRACSPNRDEPSRMWLLESGLSVGSEFNIYKTLFNVLPSVRIISLMRDDDTEAFRNAAMVDDLREHMILAEAINSSTGILLASKGQEVTQSLILRLKNFGETGGVRQPFTVLVPIKR
jgi:hypothetical protein